MYLAGVALFEKQIDDANCWKTFLLLARWLPALLPVMNSEYKLTTLLTLSHTNGWLNLACYNYNNHLSKVSLQHSSENTLYNSYATETYIYIAAVC